VSRKDGKQLAAERGDTGFLDRELAASLQHDETAARAEPSEEPPGERDVGHPVFARVSDEYRAVKGLGFGARQTALTGRKPLVGESAGLNTGIREEGLMAQAALAMGLAAGALMIASTLSQDTSPLLRRGGDPDDSGSAARRQRHPP
jgi:hypothetical protein